MEALRRTRSGTLVEDGSVTMQELKDACVAWKEDRDDSQLKAMVCRSNFCWSRCRK